MAYNINVQPVEKQNLSESTFLNIEEIFSTIQGEGPFAGQPAIFIRLAGCNLQCPGCDTDYTSNRQNLASKQIVERVLEIRGKTKLIVITGGEPFRQDFGRLVHLLIEEDFQVQIETNGTLYVPNFPYGLCTVVCSPKAGKINKQLVRHINAYKYVVNSEHIAPDGLPTHVLGLPCKMVARPPDNFTGTVYIQAMDEQDDVKNYDNLRSAIASAMLHGYTLCLQIHKIINME
jgi:7-carboxy-7-deazaguanine synthase